MSILLVSVIESKKREINDEIEKTRKRLDANNPKQKIVSIKSMKFIYLISIQ